MVWTAIAFVCFAELKRSERDGLVELPPARDFKHADAVRITRGVFTGPLALFEGQRSHERVASAATAI
jgi:hypothetical protein